MSSPMNIFEQIDHMTPFFVPTDLMEKRFENDVNNNPIYIGYSPYPNASPDMPVWYIVRVIYEGDGIVRFRQPDEGPKFTYVWSQRASYFS